MFFRSLINNRINDKNIIIRPAIDNVNNRETKINKTYLFLKLYLLRYNKTTAIIAYWPGSRNIEQNLGYNN